jgi:hypothetical protein
VNLKNFRPLTKATDKFVPMWFFYGINFSFSFTST